MEYRPKVFISPSKYVQGAGAINDLGMHIERLGAKALIVGGKNGLSVTSEGRDTSFAEAGIEQLEELFGGESTDDEILRIAKVASDLSCDVIVASGGGKVIDTVKAAAFKLGLPCAIVPTIASNDAPCSSLSVIYNDDGSFNRLELFGKNPDLVLVDTAIIANAPVRQLVAGMGDALATWFEAESAFKIGALNLPGGTITLTAMSLARLCYDTLIEYGEAAKLACENNVVTPALEKIVEANTLLSGIGFESGSVALAHALSEGFSTIPEMHAFLHGEMVAFCLLVQLVLDDADIDDVEDVYAFCSAVGLPMTLGQLNAANVDKNLLRCAAEIAAQPLRPSHNLSAPVTGKRVYNAIIAADAIGRAYLGE